MEQVTGNDWNEESFLFQKKYRENHNISATCLVHYFNLDQTLITYLYSQNMIPSKKINSSGCKLRKSLQKFKNEYLTATTRVILLEDITLRFREKLIALDIVTLFGYEDENEIQKGASVRVIVSTNIGSDIVIQKLSELDSNLFTPVIIIIVEKWIEFIHVGKALAPDSVRLL